MPCFQFNCKHCGKPFEKILASVVLVSEVVCPACGSSQVVKKSSRLSAYGSGGLSFSPSNSSPGCKTSRT